MATKRTGISTRKRFEVFKRDGFRCAYCGTTPIDGVVLHVDHINPVANGGGNESSNLITACDKCNLGKAAIPLDEKRLGVGDPRRAKEHASQLRAYMEAQREVIKARQEAEQELIDLWCQTMGVDTFHKNLRATLPKVLAEFGMAKLCEFISIVAEKRSQWDWKEDAWLIDAKYFYGILRNRRSQNGEP